MRVLFVTGSVPPMLCGVGDYTARLADEIAMQGQAVIGILTSAGAARIVSQQIDVLPVARTWRVGDGLRLLGEILKWKPDIVHIQYPTLGYGKSWFPYFLPILLKCVGLPVVQTWHEPPTRFRFFPNALTKDTLIGVEPNFLQRIRRRYAWLVRRKTTHFIPIGSNIPSVEMNEAARAAIRDKYAGPGRRMVVNFGFAYPTKGLELLFQIADSNRDTLVFITAFDPENDPYHRNLMDEMDRAEWRGRVVVTGFLEVGQVAQLLSAADAAVFPFRNGVGMRNGSFLAARAQGTFTITTSSDRQGFDVAENVFYARPDDLASMRQGLSVNIGRRLDHPFNGDIDWREIAAAHVLIYKQCLGDRHSSTDIYS